VQSDLATFGGWCFLAGVFLMVSGDGLTNVNQPVAAQAWPWLYLVPFTLSFVLMALADRIGPKQRPRAAIVHAPLSALFAVFALSTLFSQDRTLSVLALAAVAGICAFWWLTSQVLEDQRLVDATWIVGAIGVLVLALRVIAWRVTEGLDQTALLIQSVTWLGKLQVTWVFNLFAPFVLARFIGERRPAVAIFNGIVWAVVGVANFLLFARMGSLVFILTTAAVCLMNLSHWRRWALIMGGAAAGGVVIVANNLRMTAFLASTFLDRSQNQGIDLRLRVWEEAWRLFKTHPIVGIGIGTFDEIAYQSPATQANPDFHLKGWHAHNVPLHILTEAGVLGLLAWILLWCVIVHALVRAWRTGPAEARLFSSATLVSVAAFQALSMTEVLIGARVQSSLQMNLTIALLVLLGLRLSLPPADVRD
jgi:O-antigen ligase